MILSHELNLKKKPIAYCFFCIKNITQRAQFNLSNILVRKLNLSISKLSLSTSCALCGGSFFNNDFVQFYTFILVLVKINNNGRQNLDNLLLYSLLTNLFQIRDIDTKITFYILLHIKKLVWLIGFKYKIKYFYSVLSVSPTSF